MPSASRPCEIRADDRPFLARALLFLLLLTGLAACGPAAPPEPFADARPTREALAQAVVDALAARDVATLGRLAVTAVEFRKNVWPKLPASKPEVGMPVDYVWADTDTRSRAGLAQRLAEHGGASMIVSAVRFAGATTDYGWFRVHRDTHLSVRDGSGAIRDVRLFGSMLESTDGWKVYSYIVD